MFLKSVSHRSLFSWSPSSPQALFSGVGGWGMPLWHATQMCWSLHKTDKSTDRIGKASDYHFSVTSHNELLELITFSLCSDNFCWAVATTFAGLQARHISDFLLYPWEVLLVHS